MGGNQAGCFWLNSWQVGTELNAHKIIRNQPRHPIPVVPPPLEDDSIADSGASSHYLHPKYKHKCTNIIPASTGPTVQIANGELAQGTIKVAIPLPSELILSDQTGHLLKNLKTGTLFSIGQFCDNDCTALFSKYHLSIFKNGKAIIQGYRNTKNELWEISISPTNHWSIPLLSSYKHQQSNSMIRLAHIKQDLIRYLHAAAFIPVTFTFLWSIKRGHLWSWPNLTPTLVTKHLPKSMNTS